MREKGGIGRVVGLEGGKMEYNLEVKLCNTFYSVFNHSKCFYSVYLNTCDTLR